MRQSRHGQAALEFLTTYGWAIMVVLVMIGALAYFGVLSPTNLLPERCLFGTGFTCKDFITDNDGSGHLRIRFILENNLGTSVTVSSVTATSNGVSVKCMNTTASTSVTMSAGDSLLFVCPCTPLGPFCVAQPAMTYPGAGQRMKAKFALNYTEVGGAFVHPISGDIQAIVQ